MNSEFVSEEIVRMLVGDISLVVVVPITTALAVYFLKVKDRGCPGSSVVQCLPTGRRARSLIE